MRLSDTDFSAALSKADYKRRVPPLQTYLHALQRASWNAELATILVIEGWDASGKGAVIGKLTERLEPRRFRIHTIREGRSFTSQLPWMWRFWMQLPRYGEIAIFDQSWYGALFTARLEEGLRKKTWRHRCRDIVRFERTLNADRYRLVKCFLHISQEEKKARLEALAADWTTAWKVTDITRDRLDRYGEYANVIGKTIRHTGRRRSPWHVIPANDLRWARWSVLTLLAKAMEESLLANGHPLPEALPDRKSSAPQDSDTRTSS